MAATAATTKVPAILTSNTLNGIGQPMWATSTGATYYYFGATAKTSQCNAITQKPTFKPVFHYSDNQSPTNGKYLDNNCIKGWVRYYELVFPTTCWESYRDVFWSSRGNCFVYRPHSDSATAFQVYIVNPLVIGTNRLNQNVQKVIMMHIESITMLTTIPNAWTSR